jgi:hypothetical protein
VDVTRDGTSNVTIQTTQKNYHYEFFSSSGVGNEAYNFLPPYIEVP